MESPSSKRQEEGSGGGSKQDIRSRGTNTGSPSWPSANLSGSFTLSRCTAFLVSRKAGGSGALAKKSAMELFPGASNFVCRHSSYKTMQHVNLRQEKGNVMVCTREQTASTSRDVSKSVGYHTMSCTCSGYLSISGSWYICRLLYLTLLNRW